MSNNNWSQLSRAWVKDFLPSPASTLTDGATSVLQQALRRTLPLLSDDPTAIPFVCRYRADVITPLTTKQVHQLSDYVQKHDALSTLRRKILDHLRPGGSGGGDGATIFRVETSISKTELDHIYAPFRPPSKGSLEDRIAKEHPELVAQVDNLWANWGTTNADNHVLRRLKPADKAVTLLSNRLAADVEVMDALMDFSKRQCRVKVKQANGGDTQKKTRTKASSSFETYHDYTNRISSLQDHQVLAIRRGVDQKQLKLTFDLDESRVDRIIQHAAFSNKPHHPLYRDARKDAWTRLLRKRITTRLWKEKSGSAEERSIQVFCDNLHMVLLAPPARMATHQKAVLSLDPGFKNGIKCAILSEEGKVMSLDTIHFMGEARGGGIKKLVSMLVQVKNVSGTAKIGVVLGNGHGTREARLLLEEAASVGDIETELHLTSEAGASVWSVTEMAKEEFPDETPAAIAAISIGRRYLNPLNELVKIPPKSLGLGMYQHDLSEKVLDNKLSLTSTDAVAEVGVEVNSCSIEILRKVPSLTSKLCDKITKHRPLKSRSELMNISGLGPKTFQNCAAFVRVAGGHEPLDTTLVHPESYDLARWLLKRLHWKLSEASSIKSVSADQRKDECQGVARTAADKFQVTQDRVLTVIDHLYFSITDHDPRQRIDTAVQETATIGSTTGCSSLPSHASTTDTLREGNLPMRSIIATVRNVVDFGAFVDFGLENDGLLHRSKMGGVPLGSLLVGQDIGIDILGVAATNKVSVSLAGLDLPAESRNSRCPPKSATNKQQVKRKRPLDSDSKRSRGKKQRR